MRAGVATLAAGIVVAAATLLFTLRPYEAAFHSWEFALAAAVVGLGLLAQGAAGLRAETPAEGFAGLGGLGGAVLCAAMVAAAFAVGAPHLLTGSPGQTSPVRPGASVAVAFPATSEADLRGGAAPMAVIVLDGERRRELAAGESTRVRQYVLTASLGPIAYVRAASPAGKRVTVTQPQGTSFASPYLLFPGGDPAHRLDYFAVPPLHRTVDVAYYPSYRDATRRLYIATPFLLVRVTEENGAKLFEAATVSGRPLRGGGLVLVFALGQYPVVALTSAPAPLPFGLGVLMLAAGLLGYAWSTLRATKRKGS